MNKKTITTLVLLAIISNKSFTNNIQPSNRHTQVKHTTQQTIINIQNPDQNGISHNHYSQFHVTKKGIILNNAVVDTQTKNGLPIQHNSQLQKSADIILNQITSPDPSLLQGNIEIAGSSAELIIINPSGIQCDGCGFINTKDILLTTSNPFSPLQQTNGEITISPNGLSTDSQFNLIIKAHRIQIHGKIQHPGEINLQNLATLQTKYESRAKKNNKDASTDNDGNNGHGNNPDGCDPSNPGNSKKCSDSGSGSSSSSGSGSSSSGSSGSGDNDLTDETIEQAQTIQQEVLPQDNKDDIKPIEDITDIKVNDDIVDQSTYDVPQKLLSLFKQLQTNDQKVCKPINTPSIDAMLYQIISEIFLTATSKPVLMGLSETCDSTQAQSASNHQNSIDSKWLVNLYNENIILSEAHDDSNNTPGQTQIKNGLDEFVRVMKQKILKNKKNKNYSHFYWHGKSLSQLP